MLISIVTIVKNDLQGVMQTIASVKEQSYQQIEYVLIDGLSTDGTREYLIENRDLFDVFISQQDSGIADAFNLGISRCTGTYILLLNAGDKFVNPHVLAELVASGLAGTGEDIICGGVVCDLHGEKIPQKNSLPDQIPHQGMFVGTTVYRSVGAYSVCFQLRMDYEFLLRAIKRGVILTYYPFCISEYKKGGKSTLIKNRKAFYKEALTAEFLHRESVRISQILRFLYWKFIPRSLRK